MVQLVRHLLAGQVEHFGVLRRALNELQFQGVSGSASTVESKHHHLESGINIVDNLLSVLVVLLRILSEEFLLLVGVSRVKGRIIVAKERSGSHGTYNPGGRPLKACDLGSR